MGQVWSKANFDGIMAAGMRGGSGSVLAVTGHNPGSDGVWGTADDELAALNKDPGDASIDVNPGRHCQDRADRVRNFAGVHTGGALFCFADGSCHFISESSDPQVYRALGSIAGGEYIAPQ